MRQIKFRGKCAIRNNNGAWVYGDLFHNFDCGAFQTYIRQPHDEIGEFAYDDFIIDSETVGQFTGLEDKNGKEIYEGDIMRHFNYRIFEEQRKMKNLYEVVWEEYDASFSLYFINQGKPYDTYLISYKINLYGGKNLIHSGTAEKYEVIGNIHDNLELLTE